VVPPLVAGGGSSPMTGLRLIEIETGAEPCIRNVRDGRRDTVRVASTVRLASRSGGARLSMGTRAHHGAHAPQAMLRARRPWTPWTRPMTPARTPAAGQRQPSHRTHTAKPKPHTHDQVYATSRERDCLPAARARFAGTAHCQLLTPAPTLSSPVVAAPLGAPSRARSYAHTTQPRTPNMRHICSPHQHASHCHTHTHTRHTFTSASHTHHKRVSEREKREREARRARPS
jgi:hypothetical protein